jgi:tellurite resistance protein TehA-like permease
MERYAPARNVAIVVLIAAAVYYLPRGGQVAATVKAIVLVAFGALIALFASRLYREHRTTLYSLGDRLRGLLYGAIAVAVVTIAAKPRMWQTGAGEVVWFAILAAVVYLLFYIWRASRAY